MREFLNRTIFRKRSRNIIKRAIFYYGTYRLSMIKNIYNPFLFKQDVLDDFLRIGRLERRLGKILNKYN